MTTKGTTEKSIEQIFVKDFFCGCCSEVVESSSFSSGLNCQQSRSMNTALYCLSLTKCPKVGPKDLFSKSACFDKMGSHGGTSTADVRRVLSYYVRDFCLIVFVLVLVTGLKWVGLSWITVSPDLGAPRVEDGDITVSQT